MGQRNEKMSGHSYYGYLLVPLLFLVGLLQILLFEWPRRELFHCSRLFRKPGEHPTWIVHFSYRVLFTDLLRLLLLPLWVCWLLVAVVAVGVWKLGSKTSSGIRWVRRWTRIERRRKVVANEEKLRFDDSD